MLVVLNCCECLRKNLYINGGIRRKLKIFIVKVIGETRRIKMGVVLPFELDVEMRMYHNKSFPLGIIKANIDEYDCQ